MKQETTPQSVQEDKIKSGCTFKSKYLKFDVHVMEVDNANNKLKVILGEEDKIQWEEDWDLQDTVWGFDRGDYFGLIYPSPQEETKYTQGDENYVLALAQKSYESLGEVSHIKKSIAFVEPTDYSMGFVAGYNTLKAENEALKEANKELVAQFDLLAKYSVPPPKKDVFDRAMYYKAKNHFIAKENAKN